MTKQGLYTGVFLGFVLLVVMNFINVLDVYAAVGSEYARVMLTYIITAIVASCSGTTAIILAAVKYRHREAIELYKKFQMPKIGGK